MIGRPTGNGESRIPFENQVALVTGAGSGLGLATARSTGYQCRCPGLIHTPMADQMMATGQADAINAMLKDVPIGRLGRAEEIADAVLWLCSPAASVVAGHARVVDGGYTIR